MNIRIFGPPGTGKTQSLNRIIAHLTGISDAWPLLDEHGIDLPQDYTQNDITFMSYTNSAVDELMGRLAWSRTYKRGLWGTMHGIAAHLVIERNRKAKEYISNTLRKPGAVGWWKKKFTARMHIPYDPDEEISVMPGNQFFQTYSKYVNIYYPIYRSMGRIVDMLVRENEQFSEWAEAWLKFKRKHKVLDFDDFLILALESDVRPNTRVLISDEFQDFSPLQWELFKNWMVDMEYVIVGGDDDQVLFSYSGASPRFILHEFPADESIVLNHSYRLPSRILKLSRLLIRWVKDRYPKHFEPRDSGGIVTYTHLLLPKLPQLIMPLLERGKTVLFLARTNAQVKDIENVLIQTRIPYYRFKTRRTQVWRDFVDRILPFINKLKQGKRPTLTEAKFYFSLTRAKKADAIKAAHLVAENPRNLLSLRVIKDPVSLLDTAKLVEYLGSKELADLAKTALKASLEGRFDKCKGTLIIDTIHAAKGREGDVVLVWDSITNRIATEMTLEGDKGFEAEVRVWYVALTRAREAVSFLLGDAPFAYPLVMKSLRVKAHAKAN